MYKVLCDFADLEDRISETKSGTIYYVYHEGDYYPREGRKPTWDRILELGTANNRLGRPLIELPVSDDEEPAATAMDESPKEDESPKVGEAPKEVTSAGKQRKNGKREKADPASR